MATASASSRPTVAPEPHAQSPGTAPSDAPSTSDPAGGGRRRNWLIGAGTAGVAAATAVAMNKLAPSPFEPAELAKRAAVTGDGTIEADGYQVTQHVLRYYETARS